ncbi:hypothetical protein QYM36_014636, partial [Artemia franciscana]
AIVIRATDISLDDMDKPSVYPLYYDKALGTDGQAASVLVCVKTSENKDNGPLPTICIGHIGELLS